MLLVENIFCLHTSVEIRAFLTRFRVCVHPLDVASFYVDERSGFLVDDFEVKCDDGLYVLHYYIALTFVFLYALGIPVGVGWQLW